MTTINVIPASRILARVRRRRLTLWVWGNGAYASLIAALMIAGSVMRHADHSAITSRLTAARDSNNRLRLQIAELASRTSAARRMIAVHDEVSAQPDFSILLMAVATCLGDNASLTRMELTPVLEAVPARTSQNPEVRNAPPPPPLLVAYRVELAGLAHSLKDVSDLVLRLENAGIFDKVELLVTQREVRAGREAVSFQLRGTLSGDVQKGRAR